ncbi:MAG: DNA repair helicase XPB [Planctomycetota bacterium]
MIAPDGPLIVQSDGTLLLEVHHRRAQGLRHELAAIAQLSKSPEYFHEYRLTPISLWNAAQAGWTEARVLAFLDANARYPVPSELQKRVVDTLGRFGRIELIYVGGDLVLRPVVGGEEVLRQLAERPMLESYLNDPIGDGSYRIAPEYRGVIKVAMIRAGWPVRDRAGYLSGCGLALSLRNETPEGVGFALRDYQVAARDAFFADEGGGGGSGVVVLPCGAGKTMVAISILAGLQTQTLILTPNVTALRQWREELLRRTSLSPDLVCEYSGKEKRVGPVTVATYQIMTHRHAKTEDLTHFDLFAEHDWGLIVYDEVHLLPAPVFRFTAEIQARRRLGLTATLIREDGREEEVFTLIGPRIYELPWKDLEADGHIAAVSCVEVRLDLPRELRADYIAADRRHRYRLASENPRKVERLKEILQRHTGDRVLIIGQYLRQIRKVSLETGAPVITGQTPQVERDRLYDEFRGGKVPVLVVSKVGNFAVDLPDAAVAVQISGTFGSRQEEAQRLGRILRPKSDGRAAVFYSLVTRDSLDQEFAARRQRFLVEQGYQYEVDENGAEVTS